ncbi:MAG TPA: hypothetical protein VES97_02205 [Solirubrobacteraceae bacterium]|nr:hypothetical protein [Solirubrobacteraceae bacterium]
MSMIDKKTDELFMAATLGEASLGYPDDVEFVPGDQEWADDVVWRNLAEEHRPTVIVDDETELLLIPLPRRLIDRLRGSVRVHVTHRPHGQVAHYATASTLGRHPVREMREMAHA